ncbi:MAG TPA: hypothetical protein QGE93_03590 [Acidobacteriota bacterium]|jgi:hypothetical protein|nr:hypothetical protein [Acidobacteriota bacterium]MCS5702190.1 hypothetical protein [Acidobacteriota bacterium]MED5558808.1 hypothetical protein [Acidobacteriota bacterium]HJN47799.1 hypothetical protein [Acidobacteriota bacterium]
MSKSDVKTGCCRYLRTRLMHLPDMEPDPHTYGFDLSEVGHVWCDKTMRVIGPDDGLVAEEKCGPDRVCFQGS